MTLLLSLLIIAEARDLKNENFIFSAGGGLKFEAVRSRLDNSVARVFRVWIWVRCADVFQRHALTHDAGFQVADGERVLGDDFAFVGQFAIRATWVRLVGKLAFVLLHALQKVVRVFAELFGGDNGLFFGHGGGG